MADLKQQLLDELKQSGFCHDTLLELEKTCRDVLRGIPPSQVSGHDSVVLYVLSDFCSSVVDYLDGLAPVTVNLHWKIEQALAAPLRGVIDCLGNQDPGTAMKAFGVFIDAYLQLKAQP